MDPILTGLATLALGVVGLIVQIWRIRVTGTVSFAALWLIAPLTGAVVAFTVAPPSLLTISLGGTALALAGVTLAATLVLPVVLDGNDSEAAEARESDRAA